jgi:hypothetical protein
MGLCRGESPESWSIVKFCEPPGGGISLPFQDQVRQLSSPDGHRVEKFQYSMIVPSNNNIQIMGKAGLEPARLSTHDPKSAILTKHASLYVNASQLYQEKAFYGLKIYNLYHF